MKPQRGVALIVALLVVALATLLIAGLLDRGELAQARTRNGLREQQAQAYALGLEVYAAKVLMRDQPDPNVDAADSPWALPLPPTPVPGGQISAAMSDLDGRFNLNNLADSTHPNWPTNFTRLLEALKLDPKLAGNVVDWMSKTAGGDAYYLAQPIASRAGQRVFNHVSELRLVQGFDNDVYATIAPYVVALPVGTTLNVNTASVPVLMTLQPGLTAETAQAIWQHGHAHFEHLEDMPNVHTDCTYCYGTKSSYFLARGQIVLDGLPFAFQSLIERRSGRSGGADGGVRVLQRSRGSD